MAGRQLRQSDVEHRVDDATEIDEPLAIAQGLDAHRRQRFLHTTGLAHLRRSLHARHRNHVDSRPLQVIQLVATERARHRTTIDKFTGEAMRAPVANVGIATPRPLPRLVGANETTPAIGGSDG